MGYSWGLGIDRERRCRGETWHRWELFGDSVAEDSGFGAGWLGRGHGAKWSRLSGQEQLSCRR